MPKSSHLGIYLGLGLFCLLLVGYFLYAGDFVTASDYTVPIYGSLGATTSLEKIEIKKRVHLATPEPVKAIYMTSWVASTPSLRNRVVNLIKDTEINAVVIDVKDDTGKVSFMTDNQIITKIGSTENRIRDLATIIEDLHEEDIYVIARIATFQDPYLAKVRPDLAVLRSGDGAVWKDRKGLSWVDPGAEEVWAYVAEIAKEAHELGFDEINFDYIRFPSDGDLRNLTYPHSNLASTTRSAVIKNFFSYIDKTLEPLGVPLSADLFGMTTTTFDDMNIGQIFENALPYFDYVSPMIYPSHYPPHFNGYADPNEAPYEIIKYVMDSAVKRAIAASSSPDKIRPWLQDFDYPVTYTVADVKAQKQAVYDAGLTSWLMWDPSNTYTREAYDSATLIKPVSN